MTRNISIIILLFSMIFFTRGAYAEVEIMFFPMEKSADFVSTGYAVIPIVIQLAENGNPLGDQTIDLDIVSAKNYSAAFAEERKNGVFGLSWQKPALGGMDAITHISIVTNIDGQVEAVLTDIIGERDVTVRAKLANGKQSIDHIVTFGKGPLSVFAFPPTETVSWLELYEKCNGEKYGGNPKTWKVGQGYEGGSKLPSMEQIQAVSLPGKYNKQKNALGAALAAGWPVDHRYWNGRAVMQSRASHVDIRDGNIHGSGGNDVHEYEYGICLK